MLASFPAQSIFLPIVSHLLTLSALEIGPGYDTIDGYCISQEKGDDALRTGRAVLIGGLLVGLGSFE